MKRKTLLFRWSGFLILVFRFAVLGPLANRANFSWAEEKMLLGDKHKEVGTSARGATKKAPTAVCQGCHGDYKMLAERTQKVDPNPICRMGEGCLAKPITIPINLRRITRKLPQLRPQGTLGSAVSDMNPSISLQNFAHE